MSGKAMKQIRLKLVNLLNRHGKTFETCKGCEICTDIKQLRKLLVRPPEEKYKHILEKGEDMTKSDIAFLLENKVQKKSIRKALAVAQPEFWELMKNLGFSKDMPQKGKKRGEEEMALDMTPVEFVQLHHVEGKSFGEIAELKGFKKNALSNWKWLNKEKINALLSSEQPDTAKEIKSETVTVKEDKTTEYERIIARLREESAEKDEMIRQRNKANTGLNEIIEQLQNRVRDLENLHDACDDVELELASVQEKYKQLQAEYDDAVKKNLHDGYTLENQKHMIKELSKQNADLWEENKVLKFFAKKYLAV